VIPGRESIDNVYYIDNGLNPIYYWYKVRGFNTSGVGAYSDVVWSSPVKIGDFDAQGLPS
jgi:hypothetical protein